MYSRDAMEAALECRESSKGRNRVSRKKKRLIARKMRQEDKSGDEGREEKSGPRFAGCNGGAKSGLSHVDFGVKATIQSADEASARGKKKGVTADEQ